MTKDPIESAEARLTIARDVIARLGVRRAAQGLQPPHPPESPRWGYDGVDRPHKNRARYRARIRFCDAKEGKDVRISSTGYSDPADAGYWYMCAHIAAWGALSVYAAEFDPEVLAFLADSADTSIRDNLKRINVATITHPPV